MHIEGEISNVVVFARDKRGERVGPTVDGDTISVRSELLEVSDVLFVIFEVELAVIVVVWVEVGLGGGA